MTTVATSIRKENLTRKKGGIKKRRERERRVRRKRRKSGREVGTEGKTVGEQEREEAEG